VELVTRTEKAGVLPVVIKTHSAGHIGGFTHCLKGMRLWRIKRIETLNGRDLVFRFFQTPCNTGLCLSPWLKRGVLFWVQCKSVVQSDSVIWSPETRNYRLN